MEDDYDVIIVGGGIGGSTLGMALARHGMNVLIIEREIAFRDRVRGEYMHPWGVTEARKLGIYELLTKTCGHEARYRSNHIMGLPMANPRDLHRTSPHEIGSLHFYHPAMQEVLINAAAQAGAKILHGMVLQISPGETPAVKVRVSNNENNYQARLVVGADGRNSASRKWMGFEVRQDPERMMIAGVLFDNLDAPEDQVNFFINPERSIFSVFTPLGNKRFRSYAGFYQQNGYHRWSGEKAVPEYISGSVSAGVPKEWLAQVQVSGPLASFDCTETWVENPFRVGVTLVGDAAFTSDPSFGCGLSLTLRDVRVLSDNLTSTDDWDTAVKAYASEHDRYCSSIHRQIDWLTKLFYEPGELAASRRKKAFARVMEDPKRLPDIPGRGPEAPSDESAYRNLFGDD